MAVAHSAASHAFKGGPAIRGTPLSHGDPTRGPDNTACPMRTAMTVPRLLRDRQDLASPVHSARRTYTMRLLRRAAARARLHLSDLRRDMRFALADSHLRLLPFWYGHFILSPYSTVRARVTRALPNLTSATQAPPSSLPCLSRGTHRVLCSGSLHTPCTAPGTSRDKPDIREGRV